MDRILDDQLRYIIKAEIDGINPETGKGGQCLAEIHQKIRQRSGDMKFKRKNAVATAAAVAAVMVIGTVTAVAAGKITGTLSVSDRNQIVYSKEALLQSAKKQIKVSPKVVEEFSNGMTFKEGNMTEVTGMDENGNPLSAFPEIYAMYEGENGSVSLGIHEQQSWILEEPKGVQEIYQDISLNISESNYLFLPPDAEPSEEDLKLEEEGKLMISYGSSKVERKTFKWVGWNENGVDYLLSTFDHLESDVLVNMAKEIINAES